jgi:hypothetical protein
MYMYMYVTQIMSGNRISTVTTSTFTAKMMLYYCIDGEWGLDVTFFCMLRPATRQPATGTTGTTRATTTILAGRR